MVHIFFIIVSLAGGPTLLGRSDETYESTAACLKAADARVAQVNGAIESSLRHVARAICTTDENMDQLRSKGAPISKDSI